MDSKFISNSEYRFCQILWREGDICRARLVALAREELGWSSATAQAVLRRLKEREVLRQVGETVKAQVEPGEVEPLSTQMKRNRLQAICPLAFGEADVSSRIKRIRDYKKPALWMVLAAVVIIIVAAVCFLTNPAVDASQMLEFQDIPWNSTPEVVFTRLGIQGDSVTWTQDEGSRTTGTAIATATLTDWEAFGEPAQRVRFIFYNWDPDRSSIFGLARVQIFYAPDTDQEAVLSALRRAYGTEPERYSVLDNLTFDLTTRTQEQRVVYWPSEMTRGDLLTAAGRENYHAQMDEQMLEPLTQAQLENLLSTPAGNVIWRENFYAGEMFEAIVSNWPEDLVFNDTPYISIDGMFATYAAQCMNVAP